MPSFPSLSLLPHSYDIFMGAILHPRLFNGRIDIKMFAEIRVSWFLLFILTLSCAVEKVRAGERRGEGAT